MNEEKDKSREVELEMKQRNRNRGRENVILYPVVCVYCFCTSFKQINRIKEVYKQCMRNL